MTERFFSRDEFLRFVLDLPKAAWPVKSILLVQRLDGEYVIGFKTNKIPESKLNTSTKLAFSYLKTPSPLQTHVPEVSAVASPDDRRCPSDTSDY